MVKESPVKISMNRDSVKRYRRVLGGFKPREQIKMVKRANRAGLVPVNRAAKRMAPVKSGALSKSLGVQVNKRVRRGVVVAKVWPRPKFKAKGLDDDAPIDISERRAGHPRTYAYYIETGRTKSGGRIRKKGPASYLEKSYQRERMNALKAFSDRMWKEITKATQKGKK